MGANVVNHTQLRELLTKYLPARMPLLITGMPGCGKTETVHSVTESLQYRMLLEHPAVADPTDYKGLPWGLDGKTATFIPFANLAEAINSTEPTVWFFDDLGQATPAVQAACMQLFLARRINGHKLPDCITFVGATNRRVDRAGVTGILEPVKSRFDSIVELDTTIDDWCQWAYANNIPATLIAFLRFKPDMLCQFSPTSDLINSPIPRTWYNLAKNERLGLSQAVEAAAMAGAVGDGAALEYLAFRKMANSLVNLDAILMDPDKARIPSKPDELYATAIGLAARANSTNFARIAIYANRLNVEPVGKNGTTHGEFAALMVRDALWRDEAIQNNDSFVRLMSGPLGQLISGREAN